MDQHAAENPAMAVTGLLAQLGRGDLDEELFLRGIDEVIDDHGPAGIVAVIDAAVRLQGGP